MNIGENLTLRAGLFNLLDKKYAWWHVTIVPEGSGQFILRASAMDKTPDEFGGVRYDFTARVTTLTFTRP